MYEHEGVVVEGEVMSVVVRISVKRCIEVFRDLRRTRGRECAGRDQFFVLILTVIHHRVGIVICRAAFVLDIRPRSFRVSAGRWFRSRVFAKRFSQFLCSAPTPAQRFEKKPNFFFRTLAAPILRRFSLGPPRPAILIGEHSLSPVSINFRHGPSCQQRLRRQRARSTYPRHWERASSSSTKRHGWNRGTRSQLRKVRFIIFAREEDHFG